MIDFEDRANEYKNAVNLPGGDFDLVCIVEDEEDADFWKDIFIQSGFKRKPEFISYTRNFRPGGMTNDQRGKNTVLQYLPYTDKRLVLCIDSDYDLLTKTNNPSIQNNVFQTYTHSIENYKSYAPSLMNLCLEATHSTDNQLFDVEKFISDYSEIIYPLFVVFVISESKNDSTDQFLTGQKFAETIILRGDFNVNNNGTDELNELKKKVDDKFNALRSDHTDSEFEATEQRISAFGITPQNTYLFVRGHNLYDSVTLPIVRSVSKILKNNELEKIRPNIQPYFNACKDITKLLKQNKNYHSCHLMSKIRQDIIAF